MRNLLAMTDEQLAIAYMEGNNKAFDLLLSRTQNKIYSYILFLVKDRYVADDLFQETFIKVITRLKNGNYTVSGKFYAWLMRIAHNVIMDNYRFLKSDKIIDIANGNDLSYISNASMTENDIETRFVNSQILRDVEHLMNSLPISQREVVYMRFYQNIPFKEIAEATGVSIGTALGRMRYAIINLRKMAKQHKVVLEY